MRWWLKDSERRPDPEPIKTDDRLAIVVGLALWTVALAVFLLFLAPLLAAGDRWWLWTCVTGLALGLIGLVYTHRRR